MNSKYLICKAGILCHYDPSKPLKLACDASSYGLVAVISHVSPDGDTIGALVVAITSVAARTHRQRGERGKQPPGISR